MLFLKQPFINDDISDGIRHTVIHNFEIHIDLSLMLKLKSAVIKKVNLLRYDSRVKFIY